LNHAISTAALAPVIALILWSLIVWIWMYATRFPAMSAAKVQPQDCADPAHLKTALPIGTAQIAHNYNHLMEQPTLFYALALCVAVLGLGDGLNVMLLWAYVLLRIVHSLIQNTVNIVVARFAVFALSTLCLMVVTVRVALAVF
jgi:hypothetical protein